MNRGASVIPDAPPVIPSIARDLPARPAGHRTGSRARGLGMTHPSPGIRIRWLGVPLSNMPNTTRIDAAPSWPWPRYPRVGVSGWYDLPRRRDQFDRPVGEDRVYLQVAAQRIDVAPESGDVQVLLVLDPRDVRLRHAERAGQLVLRHVPGGTQPS